jgi:hypothetical protein
MKKQSMLLLFSFGFCWMLMAQNVGIGTTAPSEKLQVAGNIKADSIKLNGLQLIPNAGPGKVLISDQNGYGLWQFNQSPGNSGFGVWGDCATNGNITDYFPLADPNGAPGDNHGLSVSISGNFAIAGVYSDDIGINTNQGSAVIYEFIGTGWVFKQKITDPAGAVDDYFGTSVSISGDYAIVGANYDDVGTNVNQGSACIFRFDGNEWVYLQKITDPSGAASDFFGTSVSICDSLLIVGSYLDDNGGNTDQGSACTFKLSSGNWIFEQKLLDPSGSIGDYFGVTVAIHGHQAMVGAYVDDVGANVDQGSVIVYRYQSGTWNYLQKLTDPAGAAGDRLGTSVSISGKVAISGAYKDDVGSNTDQGSACIFVFDGATWVFSQKVFDPSGATSDHFGIHASVSDQYAFIGAYQDDINGITDMGSVTVFQKVGIGWQKLQLISDPGGASGNLMAPCAFDPTSRRFVLGAQGFAGNAGKVIFGRLF